MENQLNQSENDINATFLRVLNVSTPGSDLLFPSQDSQLMWGRSGNDLFVGSNLSHNSEQPQIDIMLGDADFMGAAEGSQLNWSDKFILGDWQQPYYTDPKKLNFGLNQFALILDFDSKQDIIQLHGISKDYQLVESTLGTAIFWQQGTVSDLIAVLPGINHLNLQGDYFQYEGYTPPKPVQGKIQQLGSIGTDLSTSSATDAFGNLYVAGATNGSLAGLNAGFNDAWVAKYDSNGKQQWIKQFGTSSSDFATSIATDNKGDFYLLGMTKGDLAAANQGTENYDVWVAKYDSNGNQQWIKQFGNELTDASFSMKVDDNGNLYISGFSIKQQQQGLFFQPGVLADDPWITKYDTNGNQQWFQTFGSPDYDEAYSIALSNDGSIYTTGWTVGDLGGKNAGLYDVWITKHDNNGQLQWTRQFGTQDYEFPKAIDTDSQGNVYITGWTLGDLGGKNAGSDDAWLAKYDSNGNQLWIKQFGTSGDDASLSMKVDGDCNIFLAGYINNDLGEKNAGVDDAWVAKYDSNGNQLWSQQFGTSKFDAATNVTSDNVGNVYVTGITDGSLGDTNAGSVDSWIAKLDSHSGVLEDFNHNP